MQPTVRDDLFVFWPRQNLASQTNKIIRCAGEISFGNLSSTRQHQNTDINSSTLSRGKNRVGVEIEAGATLSDYINNNKWQMKTLGDSNPFVEELQGSALKVR